MRGKKKERLHASLKQQQPDCREEEEKDRDKAFYHPIYNYHLVVRKKRRFIMKNIV